MAEFRERRVHHRVNTKLVVFVIYKLRQEGRDILVEERAVSDDISEGGVRILLPEELSRDKKLEVKVFLFSDPIPLPAKGRVVWSGEKQRLEIKSRPGSKEGVTKTFWAGIQFIEIDPETQDRIIRLVRNESFKKRKQN